MSDQPDTDLIERIQRDLDRLEIPEASSGAPMTRGIRRRRVAWALSGVAALVLAVAVLLPLSLLSDLGNGRQEGPAPRIVIPTVGPSPSSTGPEPSAVEQLSVHVPEPGGVVAAYGAVWVQSGPQGSLWKLSPSGAVLAKYPGMSANPSLLYAGVGGGGIQTLAAGNGSIWSLAADRVLRIDPSTGNVTATIPVDGLSSSIATGLGSVWVDSQRAKLQKIDPSTNTVIATFRLSASPAALAVGEGYVWSLAISEAPRVTRIDPNTGRPLATLYGPERAFLVTSPTAIWTASQEGDVISFDITSTKASHPRSVARTIMGITSADGVIWINAGELIGLDASTGEELLHLPIARPASGLAGIAADGHSLWLAEPGEDKVVLVSIG